MSDRPRARDLGLTIGQLPTGPLDAITDVPGLRVGHVELIAGEGPLVVGRGPVRTGTPIDCDGHTRQGIPIDRLAALIAVQRQR